MLIQSMSSLRVAWVELVLHKAGSNVAQGQFMELRVDMRVEARAVHLGIRLC